MYLLEGTAELQHHYHLKMGDVLIFAQKADSTIVLAGRPPTKADALKKPPMRRAAPAAVSKPAGRRDGVSCWRACVRWLDGRAAVPPSTSLTATMFTRVCTRLRVTPQGARGSKGSNKRRALQRFGLSADDVEPPVDGVFRAMPADSLLLSEGKSSVTQTPDGRWVASLNLGGELYQAFFVQQGDALEALNAAGYAVAASS
jgi:hypothetical protein